MEKVKFVLEWIRSLKWWQLVMLPTLVPTTVYLLALVLYNFAGVMVVATLLVGLLIYFKLLLDTTKLVVRRVVIWAIFFLVAALSLAAISVVAKIALPETYTSIAHGTGSAIGVSLGLLYGRVAAALMLSGVLTLVLLKSLARPNAEMSARFIKWTVVVLSIFLLATIPRLFDDTPATAYWAFQYAKPHVSKLSMDLAASWPVQVAKKYLNSVGTRANISGDDAVHEADVDEEASKDDRGNGQLAKVLSANVLKISESKDVESHKISKKLIKVPWDSRRPILVQVDQKREWGNITYHVAYDAYGSMEEFLVAPHMYQVCGREEFEVTSSTDASNGGLMYDSSGSQDGDDGSDESTASNTDSSGRYEKIISVPISKGYPLEFVSTGMVPEQGDLWEIRGPDSDYITEDRLLNLAFRVGDAPTGTIGINYKYDDTSSDVDLVYGVTRIITPTIGEPIRLAVMPIVDYPKNHIVVRVKRRDP